MYVEKIFPFSGYACLACGTHKSKDSLRLASPIFRKLGHHELLNFDVLRWRAQRRWAYVFAAWPAAVTGIWSFPGDNEMSLSESFLDSVFSVADSDARLRNPDNLIEYMKYSNNEPLPPGVSVGDFKKIPLGTEVRITAVKALPTGSSSRTMFALAISRDGASEHGWTSTRNLRGQFINETLGVILPEQGAGRYGPNAAWSRGNYWDRSTWLRSSTTSLKSNGSP